MHPSYELFDHTADLGVRARAGSLTELVAPAAEGFYAAVGEVAVRGPAEPFTLAFGREPARDETEGAGESLLLRDYLAELLHMFECHGRRVTRTDVTRFDAARLEVTGETRPVDESASELQREVKAITYHELAIRRVGSGVEVTFVVDI